MPQLDTLRAFAAIGVINHHWWPHYGGKFDWSFGQYGVQLFFVLSGFLITSILLRTKGRDKPLRIIGNFAMRRVLRLFPIYYLFLIVLLILRDYHVTANPGWYFTYTSNWLLFFEGQWESAYANHTWTLSVEEQFYLLFPWLITYIPAKREWVAVVPLVLFGYGLKTGWMLTYGVHGWPIELITPSNFETLGSGSLLAMILFYKPAFIYQNKLLQSLKPAIPWLVPVLLAGSIAIFHLTEEAVEWITLPIVLTGFCVLFVYQAARGFKGWAGKLFSNPVLIWLGKVSYGIYLYHKIIPYMVDRAFEYVGFEIANMYLRYAFDFLLLVVVAWASWIIIEKPVQGLKRYFEYISGKKKVPKAKS